MNIRDLEYLVALAKHQHFRKAAEACFVSQPTLSGQIKKLEDELNVALLERTSRRVLFTESGLQLVHQAQRILMEVKTFQEMASLQKKEMAGPLKIGLIPTVGPYLLPRIIQPLKENFPDLKLYLHEAQTKHLVQSLIDGKLDCIILASVLETQVFTELDLYTEKLFLAVPEKHQWAKLESVDMNLLSGETILSLDDGHCLRDQALGFCFAVGAKDDAYFKATSLETLRNMVAAGEGITLLPELAIPKTRTKDGVAYIPADNPVPSRQIILAYRPGSPQRKRFEKLAARIAQLI